MSSINSDTFCTEYSKRILVRIDCSIPDPRIIATLNRFHFTSILIDENCVSEYVYKKEVGRHLPVLEHPGGEVSLSHNYLEEIWNCFSGYLSAEGLFDNKSACNTRPDADRLADDMEMELLSILGQEREFRPDSFGLVVTHDVDVVGRSLLANFKSSGAFLINACRMAWHGKSPFWHLRMAFNFLAGMVNYYGFDQILKIAQELSFTPQFFIYSHLKGHNKLNFWERIYGVNPNYTLDDPYIVKAISSLRRHGARIGLHGSYRSYNDGDLLHREKSILVRSCGGGCDAVRQHYLKFAGIQSLKLYASLGILYESNCGGVTGDGYLCSTTRPFYGILPGEMNEGVIVFPMVFMDSEGLYFQPRGLNDLVEHREAILENLKRYRGMACVNFHQRMISSVPEYKELYKSFIVRTKELGGQVLCFQDIATFYPAES